MNQDEQSQYMELFFIDSNDSLSIYVLKSSLGVVVGVAELDVTK